MDKYITAKDSHTHGWMHYVMFSLRSTNRI